MVDDLLPVSFCSANTARYFHPQSHPTRPYPPHTAIQYPANGSVESIDQDDGGPAPATDWLLEGRAVLHAACATMQHNTHPEQG